MCVGGGGGGECKCVGGGGECKCVGGGGCACVCMDVCVLVCSVCVYVP